MRDGDARRLVLGILLPAVVLLHALCLCAGARPDAHASRVQVAAAPACHEHPDAASSERPSSKHDAPSCPHCGGEASLAVAGPPSLAPAGTFAALQLVLLPTLGSPEPIVARRSARASPRTPAAAGSALARSVVLRI